MSFVLHCAANIRCKDDAGWRIPLRAAPASGLASLLPAHPIHDLLGRRLVLAIHADIERVTLVISQRLQCGVVGFADHGVFVVAVGEVALRVVAGQIFQKLDGGILVGECLATPAPEMLMWVPRSF